MHGHFDRDSLRFQLFRLVAAAAIATLSISMAGAALFEWNTQQQHVRQSLLTVARAAGVSASAAVVFKDKTAAHAELKMLSTWKEVEAAALYTVDGRRLAVYGVTGLLPGDRDDLRESLPNFSLWQPTTTLLQPIRLDNATVGHIFIRASLHGYHDRFLQHAGLAIGINLLGLLLVLGFGLRFIDRIVAPVKGLVATSRQVREQKNFALRALPSANTPRDEIGELVASFNAMLAEIERREDEIVRYQLSLEHMVLERTEELQAANAELKSAKEAAELAAASKSRFLAAASHDLRQPVQAISLFHDALRRTVLTQEQQRIVDYLALSVHSLGDLLNALLDISKLDAGVVVAKPEAVGVHDLLGGIEAEFSPMAARQSLRFKLYFPLHDVLLFTDGALLQYLLRNLIGNALKYTRRGGILIAVRRRRDHALIQVWDTGIGIAAEHLGNIFDEYFQVGNPERDNAKGLGLGLSIAQRLARLLETRILCRSRLDRGSVFEFRLPLAGGLPPTANPPPVPEVSASKAEAIRHIVVIDDQPLVATSLQMSLSALGMAVTIYASAEEALAAADIAKADFYVCDYRLPGANGLDLLDAIQRRADRPIRAVLLTGETTPLLVETVQSSRWQILHKPIDLRQLLAAIDS